MRKDKAAHRAALRLWESVWNVIFFNGITCCCFLQYIYETGKEKMRTEKGERKKKREKTENKLLQKSNKTCTHTSYKRCTGLCRFRKMGIDKGRQMAYYINNYLSKTEKPANNIKKEENTKIYCIKYIVCLGEIKPKI